MFENGPEWLDQISRFLCNKILLIFAIIIAAIATTMFTKMWKKKQQKIAENNPNPSKSAALPLCMDILLDTIEFFTPAQCEAVLLRAPNRTLCERLERRLAHFWWTEREAIAAQDLRISRRNAELCFRADFKKWLAFDDSDDKLLLVYAIQWRIVEAVEVPGIGQGDAIFVRAEWEEMDMNGMNLPWASKIGRWLAKPFNRSDSPHRVLTRRILIESRKVFFADKCVWRVMPMSITFKCFNEAGKEKYHQGSGDPRWIVKKYCKNKLQRQFLCEYPAKAIRDQFTLDVKRNPGFWKGLMCKCKTTSPPGQYRHTLENCDPPLLNILRRNHPNFYGQLITTTPHAGHLDVDSTVPKKFEYVFTGGEAAATDSSVQSVPNGTQIRTSKKVPANLNLPIDDDGTYECPSDDEWDGKYDVVLGFERLLPLVPTASVSMQHFERRVRNPDPRIHWPDTEHWYKVLSS